MNPRYRVTALAFLSLSAGTLWVNPARADTAAPFKIDPRLLGLPALEEPIPSKTLPATPPAAPLVVIEPSPSVATPTLPSKPLPVAEPAKPVPLPPSASTPSQPAVTNKSEPLPITAVPAKPTPPISRAVEQPSIPAVSKTSLIPTSKTESLPSPECGLDKPAQTPLREAAAQRVPQLSTSSVAPPPLPPANLDGLTLRLQPALALTPHPSQPGETTPLFISAMQLQGKTDTYVEAEEDVELRKLGLRVNADHMHYDEVQETLDAKGKVRIQTDKAVVKGPDLHYKVSDGTGFMNTPAYAIVSAPGGVPGQGTADKLSFLSEDIIQLDKANFSACPVGKESWWVHASDLELDRSEDVGSGHNAWIEFKGVPILYTPYIKFSLDKGRSSGFLSPAFGTSNTRGVELTVPYYLNLAPNYDATITPRVLTKRGLQLGGEFRYLQPSYTGVIQGEVLPSDNVTKSTRDEFHITHTQNFGAGFSGNINFQKASDDNYYRDLSPLIAATSTTILPREGNLSYGNGGFGANLKVQRYQILQDPVTPIVEPYERVPQLTAGYRKLDVFGFADVLANSEYVEFGHSTNVRGSRFTLNPSVSVPLTRAYGYITPKFGVNYTRYNLDQNQNPEHLPDTTRTLPIFSLDSGLTFEREASLFGQALTQTLEPRLFYLYVPYKDQNQIPLFDSGESDFTFAQIFSENRFSGTDRISDANQVTFALTSRFIESATGLERLRASVAQRIFFTTPKVTLTPTTVAPTDKTSDFLASVGGQISPTWAADATLQYNPNIGRSEKYNVGARYTPEQGKVANFNYRYTRDALHQIDTSGQWPLSPRWQLLGRINYSIQDRKAVETLGGIEYKECCWAVRVVAHRFQTATQQTSNAIFLQLELSGLSSLGTDPFKTLKQNIGGYTKSKPLSEEINLNEF